jgi:hypothetical protein
MDTTEVLKSIEKLAEKLGVTAEKLFSYYVKEVKLYRIYYGIQAVVFLILLPIGIVLASNNYSIVFRGGYSFIQLFAFVVGCILATIGSIGIIVCLFSIPNLINAYKNPEYTAIEDLFASIIPKE